MFIMLLGAPGVGKGTQSKLIMGKCQIPQISTGDILRAEIKNETDLGTQVKSILERGELVSDDFMLKIVAKRLKQADCVNGFILDGFPRTIPQADGLGGILESIGNVKLNVVEISVPDDEIIKRLTSRRVCSQCGTLYNILVNPPMEGNACSVCGGQVFQRDDDKSETIKNRLQIYRKSTAPLIQYYKQRGDYGEVNGLKPVDSVFDEIMEILGGC